MKFVIIFLTAAFIGLVSSAVLDQDNIGGEVTNDETTPPAFDDVTTSVISDDDDDDEEGIDPETVIDGFHVKYLTEEELRDLLDEEDTKLGTELDISVARKIVEARENGEAVDNSGKRRKRWVPVVRALFTAGRALFRGSKAGRVTTSGTRTTRQYNKPGGFSTANRDFNRFNPSNVKTFNGPISGRTGTVGNHRITVRNGSSNGQPTLEIRSPKPNGEFVRKFRYDK